MMKGLGQETIQVKRCESPSKEQVTELRNTESNKVQEVMIQVKKCKSDKAACCNIGIRGPGSPSNPGITGLGSLR